MDENSEEITLLNLSAKDFNTVELLPALPANTELILGFISPDIDFKDISSRIKKYCGHIPLVLSSTAGELFSSGKSANTSLYNTGDENRQNIVLQCFSSNLIKSVDIHTVELFDPDLTPAKRTSLIENELTKFRSSFPIHYDNCVAYTLIDGLSRGESFFMEAAYNSGKLPCLIIGGSSGGKLDFQNTYIYNNHKVVQNKAVITLISFKSDIKLGVLKSQNFKEHSYSFTVAQADPAKRYIKSVIRKDTGEITDAISELCRQFNCPENKLESHLEKYSFAIVIDKDIYVRSISAIDFEAREIHFYCDLAFGDELILVEHTDFISSIESDYERFKIGKNGELLGGLFNDCILRRLINQNKLSGVKCFSDIPVGGFSTFGELLGVNINQTLTALMFYRVPAENSFHDEYIDTFIQKYSSFKEFFLKRTMNQMQHELQIKNQVWNSSMEGIGILADLIEKSSQKATENEVLLKNIHETFSKLYQNIDSSNEEGNKISGELKKLSVNAENIKNVLHDIVDIAGQINILGFNASIEAARAGAAGKGFSIIAREVKNLSDKTDKSIKESTESVSSLVKSMELLQKQTEHITTSQVSARQTSNSLNDDITQLAVNSKFIESSISENSVKVQSLNEDLNRMLKVIKLISVKE